MTFGKMLRSLSVGLLIGILAIGLLPFLLIVNGIELIGLTELESSPLYMLISRMTGRASAAAKKKRSKTADPIQPGSRTRGMNR
ncbi:hypothetical protein [Paenibacillus harenae]|uniref:hypothetical protein n=1 Tax=Paenibacillus harenae TaxID=306543 RepID=UPI000413D7E9|nr:hypothetical protein [Paenibacillus harenae]